MIELESQAFFFENVDKTFEIKSRPIYSANQSCPTQALIEFASGIFSLKLTKVQIIPSAMFPLKELC